MVGFLTGFLLGLVFCLLFNILSCPLLICLVFCIGFVVRFLFFCCYLVWFLVGFLVRFLVGFSVGSLIGFLAGFWLGFKFSKSWKSKMEYFLKNIYSQKCCDCFQSFNLSLNGFVNLTKLYYYKPWHALRCLQSFKWFLEWLCSVLEHYRYFWKIFIFEDFANICKILSSFLIVSNRFLTTSDLCKDFWKFFILAKFSKFPSSPHLSSVLPWLW